LEAIVAEGEFTVFPDIQKGQERMPEKVNKDKQYFAFGSDDMQPKRKAEEGGIENTLKSGKEMVSKFGSFLSGSIKNIVKPKNDKEAAPDVLPPPLKPETELPVDREKSASLPGKAVPPKQNETLADLKNFSAKIGASFVSFGVSSADQNHESGSRCQGLHQAQDPGAHC
jgi:hypothetical protein